MPSRNERPNALKCATVDSSREIEGSVRKVFGKADEIVADRRSGSTFGRIVGHGLRG